MKKITLLAAVLTILSTVSCSKNESGNTGILPDQNTENSKTAGTVEHTDRYVADDGESALVTFKNKAGEKSISISRELMTIQAPQKAGEEEVYADYDYTIVVKNDSITITQGDNVILLKKARKQKD